jgi:ABC transporter substrate binding protein (PQQ-dependent alcohol dehydrogenase system)
MVVSDGIIPSAWHWTWERHGAPQLNQRYQKIANRQRMSSIEWAGWAAVKSIVTSVVRSESVKFSEIVNYLSSDRLTLDNYKGAPGSFRAWNHQLRQPILLHTYNAVIASTPIKGFMHHINDLDSLGVDQGESRCSF